MTKTILLILLAFCCIVGYTQNGYIVLKKGRRSIQYFWKDSHMTFQLRDGQWLTGIVRKIAEDSFYFTQEIIHYNLYGSDTSHFSGLAFALNDVNALPTKKELIVYDNDQVRIILGHERFAWVRNGFIFQAAGAGYFMLNVINDWIGKTPPFAKSNLPGLGISAGVFLVGELLHLNFDPYIRIGKKYRLQCVVIPNSPSSFHH